MKVPYAKSGRRKQISYARSRSTATWPRTQVGQTVLHLSKEKRAIVIPLKESCGSRSSRGHCSKIRSTFLERIGEHTQAGRWIKFTSPRRLRPYDRPSRTTSTKPSNWKESGTKIDLKKPEYPIPEELQRRLDDNAVLKSAFATLTPGGGSHTFPRLICEAGKNQSSRAEKCLPMILSGRGFNELPN